MYVACLYVEYNYGECGCVFATLIWFGAAAAAGAAATLLSLLNANS